MIKRIYATRLLGISDDDLRRLEADEYERALIELARIAEDMALNSMRWCVKPRRPESEYCAGGCSPNCAASRRSSASARRKRGRSTRRLRNHAYEDRETQT